MCTWNCLVISMQELAKVHVLENNMCCQIQMNSLAGGRIKTLCLNVMILFYVGES